MISALLPDHRFVEWHTVNWTKKRLGDCSTSKMTGVLLICATTVLLPNRYVYTHLSLGTDHVPLELR